MVTAVQALMTLEQLARVGQLDTLCARHRVELLVAFGSAVTADNGDGAPRDLDVAVLFAEDADTDLVAFVHALQQVLQFDDVDVLDLGGAGIVARDQALRTARPVFERQPGTFATRQMAAMTMRMDTAWLRRLQLELLAG